MGGQRYPVYMRQAAVEAFYRMDGKVAEVAKKFEELVPDEANRPGRDRLFSFIPYWVQRFRQHGSVADTPPPGQPPRMDPATAQECIRVLLAGYKLERRQRFFCSMNDALKRSVYLRQQAELCRYNNCTFLKRLKAEDPTLSRRQLRFIKQLPRAARDKRVTYCTDMLKKGAEEMLHYLARFVWLDSKKLYACPVDHLVYAPKDAQLLVADARLPGNQYEVKKINYYCAVNAALGPVYFRICTGTTGFKELLKSRPGHRLYKVGPATAAARLPASN